MNELALFAGAGGGILGGKLLGWNTICAVERDAYAAAVLAQRQNEGKLDLFPIWSDVETFNGKPWRGLVDVVSGGFPCQDISAAGKGAGIDGKRSGLWKEMARIIREVRPKIVFVENSPMLTSRGLHRVLGDLAEMGFNAQWGVISAADVGAPHLRERIWIVAHTNSQQLQQRSTDQPERKLPYRLCQRNKTMGNPIRIRRKPGWKNNQQHDGAKLGANGKHAGKMANAHRSRSQIWNGSKNSGIPKKQLSRRESFRRDAEKSKQQWAAEPNLGRVVNGVAFRVDRIKAIGNGQVPLAAATAFNLLSQY